MLSMAQAQSWVSDHRRHNAEETELYYCSKCSPDKPVKFYCIEGHNGWDSYCYTRCSKCGSIDTEL